MALSGWSTSNYLVNNGGYTRITGTPFSAACWVYTTSSTSGNIFNILRRGATTINRDAYILYTSTTTSFLAADASGFTTVDITSHPLNQWVHLAVVCASATSRIIYRGGSGTSASSTTSRIPNTIDSLAIGIAWYNSAPQGSPFNGTIAELGFWNTTLTTSEVDSLAAGFSPLLIRPQNMQTYVPMVSSGIDYYDQGMTTAGSPTVATHPRIIKPRGNHSR